MKEDDIYAGIDQVIPKLEEVRASLTLLRVNKDRLDPFYGREGLEELLDKCVEILYDVQDGRIPF